MTRCLMRFLSLAHSSGFDRVNHLDINEEKVEIKEKTEIKENTFEFSHSPSTITIKTA